MRVGLFHYPISDIVALRPDALVRFRPGKPCHSQIRMRPRRNAPGYLADKAGTKIFENGVGKHKRTPEPENRVCGIARMLGIFLERIATSTSTGRGKDFHIDTPSASASIILR